VASSFTCVDGDKTRERQVPFGIERDQMLAGQHVQRARRDARTRSPVDEDAGAQRRRIHCECPLARAGRFLDRPVQERLHLRRRFGRVGRHLEAERRKFARLVGRRGQRARADPARDAPEEHPRRQLAPFRSEELRQERVGAQRLQAAGKIAVDVFLPRRRQQQRAIRLGRRRLRQVSDRELHRQIATLGHRRFDARRLGTDDNQGDARRLGGPRGRAQRRRQRERAHAPPVLRSRR
jgi:hypothetical protein